MHRLVRHYAALCAAGLLLAPGLPRGVPAALASPGAAGLCYSRASQVDAVSPGSADFQPAPASKQGPASGRAIPEVRPFGQHPRIVQTKGAQTIITNVRVSHDSFPDHAEPALAVNPRNPRNLLGAAMDFRDSPTPGAFASFDGGRTWRDDGALSLPPGASEGGDVSAAFDAHGTGFIAAETTGNGGPNARGVYVWRSDDGGRSFGRPVAVAQGTFVDHPSLAVDLAPGSDDLYLAWVTHVGTAHGEVDGLAFSRSVDGGRSFSAPRIVATPPGGITAPVVTAGPGGAVYAAYVTVTGGNLLHDESDSQSPGSRRTEPGSQSQESHANAAPAESSQADIATLEIVVVGSSDGGAHFGRPLLVGPTLFGLTPAPGVVVPTGPSIATDPRDGGVYVTYAGRGSILLSRSGDGGRTWNVPSRVTAAPHAGAAVYFQPRGVVDDTGAGAVSYLAMAHGRVDVWLARSAAHGTSVEQHLKITSRAFDPTLGLPGDKEGLWWIGDYQGLAAGGGIIHPFWNDTRDGHLEIFTAAVPDR